MMIIRMGQRWGSAGQCTVFPTSHVKDLLPALGHAPLSGGEMHDFLTIVMKDDSAKTREKLGVRKSAVAAAILAAKAMGNPVYKDMNTADIKGRTDRLHGGLPNQRVIPFGLDLEKGDEEHEDDEPQDRASLPPTGEIALVGVTDWDAQRAPGFLFEEAFARLRLENPDTEWSLPSE